MKKIFRSTKNTRPILPCSYRFIRSDVPKTVTASEIKWLIKENVTTIVDLRRDEERHAVSCPLENDNRFRYFSMPVSGGNEIPQRAEQVFHSYISMVDAHMELIIKTIIEAKSNVLYFCTAGKDRTGVVSAILLHKIGMDSEYIIEDYMKSKDNLKDMFQKLSAENAAVDINILIPRREYIEEFLRYISDRNLI